MHIPFGEYHLRSWRYDDAGSIVKYADNQRVAIQMRDGFPHPYGPADAEKFLSSAVGADPCTMFAIATPAEAIGGIGLLLGQDVHRLTAEVGYWLAEPYWNRGIVTSAVQCMVDYAFRDLGLCRVCAEPYASNPASARVLEKAGFAEEGVMRANVIKAGKVLDQLLFAIVRDDVE